MYGILRGKHAQQPKRGGQIKGPGTGTSDSIKAEVPAGSYIMPADSTAALGFSPAVAAGEAPAGTPGVPVNLSNGEHQLPPEQVHAVGVQALEQAKAATHTPVAQPQAQGGELFFANGGVVEDPLKKKQTSFDATNTQVSPGYSGFRPAAALQQASDSRHQQAAVRADAAQATVSRAANGSVDTAMQVGAVQNSLPPKVPAAPPAAVAREAAGFAPGLKIMQPARDAQMVRRIRAEEQGAPVKAAPASAQAPVPADRGMVDELADGLGGAAKTAVGVLAYPQLAAYDGLRNAAGTIAGGDTSQIKQYRDDASGFAAEGMTQMQDSSRALREGAASGTREALGIDAVAPITPTPAASPAVTANQQPAPAAGAPNPSARPASKNPGANTVAPGAWANTGIGVGAEGGAIAARTGADGTPEFTNDAKVVAGAVAMPAAGFGSTSAAGKANMGDDVALEQRGSINNVGNGVGTFSQAEAGDAALAAGRFERANEERAKMVAASKAGEPNGGLTIVGDSSRKPSLQERQLARLNERNANIEAMQARTELGFAALNQRNANEQVQQQKMQQDMQAGQLTLEQQQRIAQIQQQLADPGLAPDQRAQLESAYYSLTGNTKDRYMEVTGGTNADGAKDASKVFDSRSGKFIEDGSSGQQQADMAQARRIIAADPSKQAEVERRFKEKYGQGLEG